MSSGVLLSPQLRRENVEFEDIYLTLRCWYILTSGSESKCRGMEAGSLSKSLRQKLRSLLTQGGSAYSSVRNIVKYSNLPVSKIRISAFKDCIQDISRASRKFKRTKAFATCIDPALVDKLQEVNDGAKVFTRSSRLP